MQMQISSQKCGRRKSVYSHVDRWIHKVFHSFREVPPKWDDVDNNNYSQYDNGGRLRERLLVTEKPGRQIIIRFCDIDSISGRNDAGLPPMLVPEEVEVRHWKSRTPEAKSCQIWTVVSLKLFQVGIPKR